MIGAVVSAGVTKPVHDVLQIPLLRLLHLAVEHAARADAGQHEHLLRAEDDGQQGEQDAGVEQGAGGPVAVCGAGPLQAGGYCCEKQAALGAGSEGWEEGGRW